jgi:hypothetical protein
MRQKTRHPMKTSLVLLLLPVAALAAPTVAVSTFQSDAAVSSALGTHDAGVSVSRILSSDLSALAPLVVVDADEGAQSPQGAAATVVSGRVSMEGTDTVLTARVTPPGMSRPTETTVRTEKSTSIADAVSLLAMQVGKIALTQNGAEAVAWGPAAIVGTARPATLFTFQQVASVMSIDGTAVSNETQTWNTKRPLLPGLHSIFVRYYDGTATAGHSFTLFAKPGVQYAVRYDRPSGENPRLWISDEFSGKPVTVIAMASVGDPARVIQGAIDSDPRGLFSPSNNPAYTVKMAAAGK